MPGFCALAALLASAALLQPAPVSAAVGLNPHISNFAQVNNHLYRGGQPSGAGFRNLAKLGVRTVVDLRDGDGHARAERKLVEAAGMYYIHAPLPRLHAPANAEIAALLTVLNDRSKWPLFIHCKRGADRTGTVIACYRVAGDHWDNRKALAEAKQHRMSWIEQAMQRYILTFKPPDPIRAAAAAPSPLHLKNSDLTTSDLRSSGVQTALVSP